MVVLVTTSRNPSRRTRSFVKDLTSVVKDVIRINRGKKTFDDLLNIARIYESRGVVIVLERRGNPSALSYYVNNDGELVRVMVIKLASIKLLREVKEAQRPLNVCGLVLDEESIEGGVPTDIVEAIKTVLDVRSNTVADTLSDVVRLKFRYEGQHITLNFVCIGSGKVCGPELKILKVIRNGS